MKNIFVQIVEKIKKISPVIKTYHVENIFVFTALAVVAVFFRQELIEWVGVLAVFATFNHASVSNRLEESEDIRSKDQYSTIVECYKKQTQYFYSKEILWFIYFVVLGAWSALVGVLLFLLYPLWRKTWRKYHP